MSKRKLSKTAMNFVHECRSSPDEIYTFSDIVGLLNERFGVTITISAVSKNYTRYLDRLNKKLDSPMAVSVDQDSEQATVNKPVLPENQRKPQIDPMTLVLGTGIREAEPEPLSSNTNIDPVVGDSEKNQPKPRLSNNRKFGIGDAPFKHNEVPSPELLKLLGIENT